MYTGAGPVPQKQAPPPVPTAGEEQPAVVFNGPLASLGFVDVLPQCLVKDRKNPKYQDFTCVTAAQVYYRKYHGILCETRSVIFFQNFDVDRQPLAAAQPALPTVALRVH